MKHNQYEALEQVKLFKWIGFIKARYPEFDLLYHIPNGGSRDIREATNLKHQGVKPGVPDLCLPVARGKYHGLYIEMKYGKNKTTDNQSKWLKLLSEQGYATAVCYGWEKASEILLKYINLR